MSNGCVGQEIMRKPQQPGSTPYIKMNLGFLPKRSIPRDELLEKANGNMTSVTSMSATKIDIRAKPRLTRSFSVTPTCGTSNAPFRASYSNGFSFGRPKLSRNVWGSSPEPTKITDFEKMPEMKVSLKLIQVQAAEKSEEPVISSQTNIFNNHDNPQIFNDQNQMINRHGFGKGLKNGRQQTTIHGYDGRQFIEGYDERQSFSLRRTTSSYISTPAPTLTPRKQLLSMSEEKTKKILEGKDTKSQGEFVGRAGLTYQQSEAINARQQEQVSKRSFARTYVHEIARDAIFTDRKKTELLKQWPVIFYEMVYSSVTEMGDMQTYMKKSLEELERS
ncbi:hypothetical protein FSP39_014781 [Pinctada imbricata]|uniref:Uncharacterized protein n=1 Tax=Pinctada imbricata TaxID=66713 RepID=A0AA88Y4N5_PINIB|nr:hypothetical protein FSP39_014781 [Pinctada imbricata]